MSRPARYRHHLEVAKDEALFACDLYNDRTCKRGLEAFLVHMNIAWNNLLQAILAQTKTNVYYKSTNGRFLRTAEGEKRVLSLRDMLQHVMPDASDPVRNNVAFFIGLRDKVEHRLTLAEQHALRTIVGGKSQAYLRNFEATLIEHFRDQSVANELRLPLFLSALNEDAIKAIKSIRSTVPKDVISYIDSFESVLDERAKASIAYDFRILLIPQTGNRTNSDLAVQFVDVSKLTPEQAENFERALVIARDRHVEVANLNRLKPLEVVERVKAHVPSFTTQAHTDAWRYFAVRPRSNASDKTKTDAKYCVYDRAHDDYVYAEAWVKKLITALEANADDVIKTWRRGKK